MSKIIEKKLENVFIKIFNLRKQNNSYNYLKNLSEKNYPKWDSLRKLNLIIAVEQEFKFKLKDKDIENFDSFKKILNIIKNK